jgi:hypothetical protein
MVNPISGVIALLRGWVVSQPDNETGATPEDILREYRWLQRTPSGGPHARQYHRLQRMVLLNQNSLLAAILAGGLSDTEVSELAHFGGHGGSVAKKDNLHWTSFMAKLREHREELPEGTQHHLDWLLRVHGW